MPQKISIVDRIEDERNELRDLIKKGKPSVRKVARVHILLLADAGAADKAIVLPRPSGDRGTDTQTFGRRRSGAP